MARREWQAAAGCEGRGSGRAEREPGWWLLRPVSDAWRGRLTGRVLACLFSDAGWAEGGSSSAAASAADAAGAGRGADADTARRADLAVCSLNQTRAVVIGA